MNSKEDGIKNSIRLQGWLVNNMNSEQKVHNERSRAFIPNQSKCTMQAPQAQSQHQSPTATFGVSTSFIRCTRCGPVLWIGCMCTSGKYRYGQASRAMR